MWATVKIQKYSPFSEISISIFVFIYSGTEKPFFLFVTLYDEWKIIYNRIDPEFFLDFCDLFVEFSVNL